jgi:hypothetical protein
VGEEGGAGGGRSPRSGVDGHCCSCASGAVAGGGWSTLPASAGVGPYLDSVPRCGVFRWWEGSSCSWWLRRRRGEERAAEVSRWGRGRSCLCGTGRPQWPGSRACWRRPWRCGRGLEAGRPGGSRCRCLCRLDVVSLSSTSGHARLRHGSAPGVDEVLTPTTRVSASDPGHSSTTGSSVTPERRGLHPGSGALPGGGAQARPSPDYGSGGWGFESLAAHHHHCWSAAL